MSSTDPFKALGLKRATATEAEVKAAYARLLKATRPEDDRAAFMALRQDFDAARRSARAADARRAAAQAEQGDEADSAAAEAPQTPASEAPAPEVTWHFDADLRWNFSDSPTGTLIEKTIRWMLAGGPDADMFAADASEALLAGGVDGAAFRAEVISFISSAADPKNTHQGTSLWEPLTLERPDWLNATIIGVLRDDLGLLRGRPNDAWTARAYNAVRALLAEASGDPADLPAPIDIEAIIEREETEARGDAHGSYYDRKARVWVDRSPVALAMQDLQAAFDRNMWDLPQTARAILARDEVQALDEFQDLDARLRQHVCAATGQHEGGRAPSYPAWLRPQVIELFDATFGWSRQFGRHHWDRQQYQWLHQVLSRDIDIRGQMPEFRSAPAPWPDYHQPADRPVSRYNLWAWLLREPRNLVMAYMGYRAIQILWRLVL